jgi:microcystin-dependent protein
MMVCAALLSTLSVEARAQSYAKSNYIGQLIAVAGGYCPPDTVPAAGQMLQTSQNAALSAVLGNTYGGDFEHTFKLPDLRGRVPLGAPEPGPKLGGTGGVQHQQIDLPPKSAGATPVDIQGTPYLTINWCIVTTGVFPVSPR